MKSFDYTNTQPKAEVGTEEVVKEKVTLDKAQNLPGAIPNINEAEFIAEPKTMIEAIEQERQKALYKESERHNNINAAINSKFDELKRIETERDLTIQKAFNKAQQDLDEIDNLIAERRTGIFDEVKEIAQEFNARFNPESKLEE
ncbi:MULTISPECIES: hypothetical protein [Lactococcus]|uniref:Uncharacterized protein n=1 Tax=Lactococcus garvieae TaxID=1363 RepID=H2B2T4_9LACT|nr:MULTISPECIES: hypothetical protein [Lactococcus]CCF71043.1 hypothetical protein [Lactococcus garvieae]